MTRKADGNDFIDFQPRENISCGELFRGLPG
jgi:hypothetical protein